MAGCSWSLRYNHDVWVIMADAGSSLMGIGTATEKIRFSAEFIEMRRQGLDLFVNRIASHPELRLSDYLRLFLQADEETMERVRAQDLGIFKKPSDLMQIFKGRRSLLKNHLPSMRR